MSDIIGSDKRNSAWVEKIRFAEKLKGGAG